MLRKKTRTILLTAFTLLGLSVSVFLSTPASKAAFGSSPPWVRNDHMLPGTTFEQIINLSRSDTEEKMQTVVRVTGEEDLVRWITIENEEKLIMEKGQSILPMKVIITVPEDAAIKNYKGGIYLSLVPKTSVGGGEVAIGLGAHISVDITVIGDAVTDYQILSVSVEPLIKNTPFSINFEVQNKGNTEIRDLNGQVKIYDSNNINLLKTLDFVPFDQSVLPNETKIVRMTFPDQILAPGAYWVTIKALDGEKTIYENRFPQKVGAVFVTKPSLPNLGLEIDAIETLEGEELIGEMAEQEETVKEPEKTPNAQAQEEEVKPAAPPAVKTNTTFLIIGLVGMGFALIEVIGITVFLIKARKSRLKKMIN